MGAAFFFLAGDSLWVSVLVGIAWAAGVLASDWQRRKIKKLEGDLQFAAAGFDRIKEIIDDEILACREEAHDSSQAHDGGVEIHESEGDMLEMLYKRLFPGEER